MEHAEHIPMNHVAQRKKAIIAELAATLESLWFYFSCATDLLLRFQQNLMIIENLNIEDGQDQVQIAKLQPDQLQNEVAVDALFVLSHPRVKYIMFNFLGKIFTLTPYCFFWFKTMVFYLIEEFVINVDILETML